jgi:hypothetical protein
LDTLITASSRHDDKTVSGNIPTQGQPAKVMWLVGHTLAQSFPHVILSVIMSYFGHNEDMHGFWSAWCSSII